MEVGKIGKQKKNDDSVHAGVPAPFSAKDTAAALLLGAVLFFVICLSSAATVKTMAIVLCFCLLSISFICFGALRERLWLPALVLGAYMAMDGVSASYAIAGKFALYEFLKVLCAFCLAMLLTAAAPGRGDRPARWIAVILETAAAFAGLVSIDLLSTHFVSGGVLSVLGRVTQDYEGLAGVEAGVRMTSVFGNPNIFAGCAGIGVLLSLGLALSSESTGERYVHCALLYINSLAFVLAFSMGASGAIACAFVAYLLLEKKERRPETLALMLETLVLTIAAAAAVSMTSFGIWEGVNPVPLLCALLGAAALCAADRFASRRLAGAKLLRGRAVPVTVLAVVCVLAVYILAAWSWTGGVTLDAGSFLRRAAYPEAGTYTLQIDSDGPAYVSIESQNRQETMMHTSTLLYDGQARGAEFTVPEESLVVYFNFSTPEGARITSAACAGGGGAVKIPLGYRLLPGFIANRLQGLLANENAIQRFVFFDDGMKLFRRSPVIGLGMGAYENAIKSVQPFNYETKYAHNHYIQALVETGVVGLLLFVSVFAVSAASLFKARRKENASPVLPALGALLVFMAVHGAVEVVFSSYPYLPLAFGVFALVNLSCGDSFKRPRLGNAAKTVSLLCVCAFVGVYGVLTLMNVRAMLLVASEPTFQSLEEAAKRDKFEWADYLLTYVDSSTTDEANDEVREKAVEYAEKLARVESNSVPFFLADYYFKTGKPEQALEMLEKYVDYVPSDEAAWNDAFHLLELYGQSDRLCREGAAGLMEILEDWTARNIGVITLDEASQAFVERYGP
ncbi:MAG: O-antigen ligase family protein [Ruminococcus flavefaciens]|nr:O-antigen ligase family protein [Ruminococcus flavefaciens]